MKKVLLFMVIFLVACAPDLSQVFETEPVPTQTETITVQPLIPTEIQATTPAVESSSETQPWWNETVFYEVFVRSFYDSDGDGVGDLNGLIQKLDYLNDGDPTTDNDLGVTGIWLMPIMESTSYHGYDVIDYFSVDQEYGTNADFQRLMEEAHNRGIRIIVDLMLNHSSNQHPWFLESQKVASTYRDWYLWESEKPIYRGPWNQEVWHKLGEEYYYGVFWSGMPDFNLTNPDLTQELYDITRFWLEDMKVDGFRLDGIKHLIENGFAQENTKETHAWLEAFFEFYKGIHSDSFAVGEAWTSTSEIIEYTGDEVDIAFAFDLAEAIINTARGPLAIPVMKEMSQVVESFPQGQYATFLTNHDQNRVMSQLRGDIGKAKIAATILLTSPGVPFIYYGEEIGMSGGKPDEDIRRPMQWSAENISAGMSSGTPWRLPASDYLNTNLEIQVDDPDSLYNHYRKLIHLRNEHPALRYGAWIPVETGLPQLYAYLRHYGEEVFLILINVNPKDVSSENYSLSLDSGPLSGSPDAVSRLGLADPISPMVNEGGGFTEYVPFDVLPAQSFVVIEFLP